MQTVVIIAVIAVVITGVLWYRQRRQKNIQEAVVPTEEGGER